MKPEELHKLYNLTEIVLLLTLIINYKGLYAYVSRAQAIGGLRRDERWEESFSVVSLPQF